MRSLGWPKPTQHGNITITEHHLLHGHKNILGPQAFHLVTQVPPWTQFQTKKDFNLEDPSPWQLQVYYQCHTGDILPENAIQIASIAAFLVFASATWKQVIWNSLGVVQNPCQSEPCYIPNYDLHFLLVLFKQYRYIDAPFCRTNEFQSIIHTMPVQFRTSLLNLCCPKQISQSFHSTSEPKSRI